MDKSNVMQLVTVTYTTDTLGQKVPAESNRTVFCNLASVTQSEWYEAGRAGLKAEYRATIFAADYNGETIAILNNVRYGIYRTYMSGGDDIELYLERRAGA